MNGEIGRICGEGSEENASDGEGIFHVQAEGAKAVRISRVDSKIVQGLPPLAWTQ
jgi:hypothetical protein